MENAMKILSCAIGLLTLAALVSAVNAADPATAPTATQKQSAETLKKVLLAANLYANDHNDEWPKKLDELVGGDLLDNKAVLSDPADPKKRPWVYHPWTPAQMKKLDTSTAPVAWSPIDDPKAPRNVGFLDGHVELVPDKAAADKLLAAAEAAAKK
jgi:prepilin-type processing-associated H-X9-DG protein